MAVARYDHGGGIGHGYQPGPKPHSRSGCDLTAQVPPCPLCKNHRPMSSLNYVRANLMRQQKRM